MRITQPLSSRIALLLIAFLGLLAASTTPAMAASISVTNASPASRDAMAYSNFTMAMGFSGSTPKAVTVDLPKGQLGALANASTCTVTNWQNDNCAANTQLGTISTEVTARAVATLGLPVNLTATGGMYRLPATGNEVGRFGLTVASSLSETMYIQGTFKLRNDGSYAIRAEVPTIPNTAKVSFFGLGLGDANITINEMTLVMLGRVGNVTNGPGFFFNPAECVLATTNVSYTAWDNTSSAGSSSYTPINCNAAPFDPTVAFGPASATAASPTAFSVNVTQPYVATAAKVNAPFKNVTLTLPPGVQLTGASNSDGALVACTDAQFNVTQNTPSSCPAGAKIGTVTMDSPLIGAVPGDVFLAQPSAPTGANDLIRLFIVAQLGTATDNVRVKFPADVSIDPTTGRLITTLTNLPAQPVRSFAFTFRGGTSPATRNPRTCATYVGNASLVSYAAATVVPKSGNYVVDQGCPPAGRFRPTIGMVQTPNRAGASATGVTTIDLPVGDEAFTSVTASLPAGLLANIASVTRCTTAQVAASSCPVASKVGSVLDLAGQSSVPGTFSGDIFLTDAPDATSIAGLFITVPVQVGPIFIDDLEVHAKIRLRTDYGIDVISTVPDEVRKLQLDQQRLRLTFDRANFMTNPPVCAGNAISGTFGSAEGTSASNTSAVTITGCAGMAFDPQLAFTAAPATAAGASALTTTVTLPAGEQSPPKSITVSLPDEVSLSPSASSGSTNLTGCTDAQFAKATFADPTCPAASVVGTTSIQTPSVGALSGNAYLGTAPAGHTARIFVDAKSVTFGDQARVKLEGLLDVNATTGKTTVVFDGIPPVSFTSFALTMRGGTNPVLSVPRTCGTYTGGSTMVPHSGATASPAGSLVINAGCADATSFAPTISATTSPTQAGADATLTTTVNVPERHRFLSKLDLSLPAGLLAKIDGAPRCSIAAATAGTCAVSTRIGSVDALAGQGTTPGAFAGSLYLTDAPSAGDVVGIAVELPAVVGPVDLGKVITIASVRLRPSDYGIDVTADVPTAAQGVPLFLRQLKLTIDKAGFITNPVTCGATATTSTLTAAGGSTATPSSPFAATGCGTLGFNPAVSFSGSPARAAGASAFTTRITAPASAPGSEQGALKKAVVDLPTGVSLSPSINSGGTNLSGCTAAQFARTTFADPTCAATSAIGTAQIDVPQVGTLAGNVYLAQTAPSGAIAGLFVDAKSATFGASVRVKLDGRVDVDAATGKTTATFDDVPSIAFTAFELALRGGTNPAVSMPRVCGTPTGTAALTPQLGAAVTRNATLTVIQNCADDTSFGAAGTVALSDSRAGQDTSLTTTITVPSGHRELRKVEISLPAGLLANIDGKARCTVPAATDGSCAASTQVGTIAATAGQGTTPGTFPGKVYLVDAPTSEDIVGLGLSIPVQVGPIDLGFVNVIAGVKLRSDYGIDITAAVPTEVKGIPMYLRSLDIAITKPGFLFNPSTCGTKNTTLALTSALYGADRSTSNRTDTFTITDCDTLAFSPALAFSANPAKAGGAAALTTAITLPATAQSALRSATVRLPAGVSLSPSIDSSGTLTGCTDAQFDQTTPSTAPTCPAAAKIGDTAITTSSVGELTGDVYLAATAPGHLARVFVDAASSAFPGARVKMSGVVDVDEATGVTTAVFSDAPEVPFTRFAITFRGGSAPALSMPRICGTPSGTATLTSHAGGAPLDRSASLTIDEDCGTASQFSPGTTISTSPTKAAASTALTTTIAVPAGQQELSRVRLSLPAGLIARIDGHPTCTLVAANAGTCAANTKIGSISAKAGQGDAPATFGGGSVYLTAAPSAGDLVGLAIELPVTVGQVGSNPIVDLGKVTVVGGITLRQDYGIDIDIAVPTKVKGIPMHLRELALRIDEPGFMVNPATCTGNALTGTLNAAQGGSAGINTALTVTDCASMAFDPSVAFTASPSKASGPASFTTRLSLPASGDLAPLKSAAVTLPAGTSLSASADALGDLAGCTDAQFSKATWNDPTCPAPSKVGTVTIQTPAVGAITGDAYLAATAPNGSLARVFIDATSTAFAAKVRIKVEGRIAVDPVSGTTVATFDDLPPVAFTNFALTLRGAPNPVLSLPRTCGSAAGSAILTSHGGVNASRGGSLVLDQGCPNEDQFGPTVAFDLSPSGAGDAGKLTTTIAVPGGDQELSRIKLDLPEGLTAKLKGTARCSIADAQADACPAGTQLGTAIAKVGVDGAPFTENGGRVYLTDGRGGNVAGMAIVLPAKVGPIDLGKVITIADVQLRSPDLALQITADVPTSVKGVRLDLRELKLAITKDDFLVNPSSCGVLSGTARFTSKADRTATDDSTITIPPASCQAQSFDARIAFDAGNPTPGEASTFTTTVSLTDGPGAESPFKSVAVRLPEGMSLSASADARGDLAGCTDAQFRQDDLSVASTCPAGSEIGTAKFETDLVGDLIGKAYLAPATNGNLARVFLETTATDVPNLTVRVEGEIRVDETTGATDAVFAKVPAIPVTRFVVSFRGGDAPTLALPRLCGNAEGSGTFVPANGGSQQVRGAALALATGCPDPAAFAPTVALGRSTTAAGRAMAFTTTVDVPAGQQELSSLKMVLPAGLLGKISSIPACSRADGDAGTCGADSKVGSVSAQVGVASAPFAVAGSAYLVKGDADSIARLSIVLPAKVGPIDLGKVVTIAELKLRGDYGLDITAATIPTTVKGVRLDLHRLVLAIDRPDFMVNQVSCDAATGRTTLGSAQGGSVAREQAMTADSCDQLRLQASLAYNAAPASPLTSSAVTTSIRAGAGAGEALDAMRSVRVTMPEGLSLSPSAGARGDLAECTPGDFRAGDITVDAACPAGSKVGSVTITSPMVGTLSGDAYLGAKSADHFAGIFLQAKAADYPSLRVKLAGTLDVDPATGRLTAAFSDLPLVQVASIDLTLRGGDAPVLSLPRTCGTFGADVNILRHGGGTSDATGALVLDAGCPDPGAFAPSLALSQSSTQAGGDTALSTVITVPARQQELRSLDLAMPAGLLGRLTVAPKCPLADARAGSCSDASLVGTAKAKVGVATAPFEVTGKVYVTEGFDGSIAGLMFALPAKVGPIDLGTVVTMAQLKITGNDLRLGITAADIPTRVKGIPLSISELGIQIDKPGFVLNGTTCGDKPAAAMFTSAQGGTAGSNANVGTTGCDRLSWQPKFSVAFSGAPAELKKLGHPTLSTVIEQTEGQGNLRTADVTLPTGVVADLTNVNKRQCASAATAIAGNCPESAKIGVAEIRTSALPEPVDAAITLVDLPDASLPGLAITVRDQITFDIVGTTKLDKAGRLIANFDGLPDTPISKMTLVFNGGTGGVLQLSTEACTSGVQTDGVLTAQHGAKKSFALPVTCNGRTTALGAGGSGAVSIALATASFKPSGSSSALTFALSNPAGISKIVLKMPKGAIFTKKAAKLVKLSLTGAKARTVVVNGERRMAISIKPLVAGQKVTKVKFKLPKKAIKINIKVRRVLENEKTSKKKKVKLLAKLLKPSVTMIDGAGTSTAVKITTKVSPK